MVERIRKNADKREKEMNEDHKAEVMELQQKLRGERDQYQLLNDNMQVLTRRINELELQSTQKEK